MFQTPGVVLVGPSCVVVPMTQDPFLAGTQRHIALTAAHEPSCSAISFIMSKILLSVARTCQCTACRLGGRGDSSHCWRQIEIISCGYRLCILWRVIELHD